MDIWPQRLYYQSTISFPCCVSIRTTIFFNSVCPLITETLPLLCPRAHSHNLPRWILKRDIRPRGCGIQRKLFDIPSILEIVYVYHMVYESGLYWLRYKTAGGLPMLQNLFPEGKKGEYEGHLMTFILIYAALPQMQIKTLRNWGPNWWTWPLVKGHSKGEVNDLEAITTHRRSCLPITIGLFP